VKLNWDASYMQDENKGGWGIILRDDRGNIMLTAWGSIDRCPSAETTKAVAGLPSLRTCLPFIVLLHDRFT
jgi:hypothetical protein